MYTIINSTTAQSEHLATHRLVHRVVFLFLTRQPVRPKIRLLFLEEAMPRQRRILIIDPDDTHLITWRNELGEKFHVTSVQNIPDAEELIAETPEFAAIVVESFEDAGVLLAIPFIHRLRLLFRKPIIGVAAKHEHKQQMILAGCNIYATRYELPDKIYEALKIYSPITKKKKLPKVKKSFQKAQRKKADKTT